MAVKTFKPTTPSRRQMTVPSFEEITKKTPEKSLITVLKKHAGRNNTGKITSTEFIETLTTAQPDFKTWLQEIDALDKDQLGNSRGSGEWWPGSYQKN